MALHKAAIIGVGLLGGSFALALKKHFPAVQIVGFGRSESNLKDAFNRSIIDSFETSIDKAVSEADLVVIATPVGTFVELVKKMSPYLKQGALVIDLGSVKGALVYELYSIMPEGVFYVPCHPIAGGHKSGIDSASASIFEKALCVITKSADTDMTASDEVSALWRKFGSVVKYMNPDEHDMVYAAVSHLPHLISFALVNTISDINPGLIEFAGKGFMDTTRIAESDQVMWRDIFMANRDNMLKFLDIYKSNIERLSERMKNCDSDGLADDLLKSKELRKKLGEIHAKD